MTQSQYRYLQVIHAMRPFLLKTLLGAFKSRAWWGKVNFESFQETPNHFRSNAFSSSHTFMCRLLRRNIVRRPEARLPAAYWDKQWGKKASGVDDSFRGD